VLHVDVLVTFDGLMRTSSRRGGYRGSPVVSAEYSHDRGPLGPAVSCYYDEDGSLGCIAVNALRGPQVVLNGLRLVRRVPSELKKDFDEYTAAYGHDLCYSQHADPGSQALGTMLRPSAPGMSS
jgi:hypothetical protein